MVNFFEEKEEKDKILKAFREIDKDGNGTLTKEEMEEFVKNH